MERILRIFPTRTHATPDDELVRVNAAPSLFDMALEVDEVHISVAFTWHKGWAEWAAGQWERIAPVKLGGPAYNEQGGDFVPGRYMRQGYVITSRGCPNRCWFCSVPVREGGVLRELPVTDGWIVTDDNLLACSPGHIDAVFSMLKRQPHRPQFVGGLEAARMTEDFAARLKEVKPETMYFAYDTPNDLPPLVEAGRLLRKAGFTKESHYACCYVLCGYRGDTFDKAQARMGEAWKAGFLPFAMLYRDEQGQRAKEWIKFQGQWANHIITPLNCVKYFGK